MLDLGLLDDDGDFVHVKCYCCCCLVNGLLNSAGYINSFDYLKVSLIVLGVNYTINSKYCRRFHDIFEKTYEYPFSP